MLQSISSGLKLYESYVGFVPTSTRMLLDENLIWPWGKNFTDFHYEHKLPIERMRQSILLNHRDISEISYEPKKYMYYWLKTTKIKRLHPGRRAVMNPEPYRAWACTELKYVLATSKIHKIDSKLWAMLAATMFNARRAVTLHQLYSNLGSRIPTRTPFDKFKPVVWAVDGVFKLKGHLKNVPPEVINTTTYITIPHPTEKLLDDAVYIY